MKPSLSTIGEALYGPRWQSDLARDLKVSDRTMRRWIADQTMPDGVWTELRALLSKRQALIVNLLTEISEST